MNVRSTAHYLRTVLLWAVAFATAAIVLATFARVQEPTPLAHAQVPAANGGVLSGSAWSSNIGWIELVGTGWGVYLSPSDGTSLLGYAWSSSIGWLQFGATSCGSAASVSGTKPLVTLTGWAKAVSAGGGWDGCIKLSNVGTPSYGVSINSYSQVSQGGLLEGYAWGSDVIGWLRFDPAPGGAYLKFASCNNGLDDDHDGLADAADSDCPDLTSNGEQTTGTSGASVDIKANGKDALSVRKDSSVVITWTTSGMGNCTLTTSDGTSPVSDQNTTGTTYGVSATSGFTLTCNELVGGLPTGPARSDTIAVRLLPMYREI
jgi:hypothetical protein